MAFPLASTSTRRSPAMLLIGLKADPSKWANHGSSVGSSFINLPVRQSMKLSTLLRNGSSREQMCDR